MERRPSECDMVTRAGPSGIGFVPLLKDTAELFALATTGRTGELMPPKNQEVGSPQSLNLLVP